MSVKRIVFEDAGGLSHILGVWDEAVEGPLAITAGPLQLGEQVIPFISLVRVTTRAAYYRAPLVPASYSFHGAQQ